MEENTFERIEAYLSGELSFEEAQAFEEEMGSNKELAEEVALQRDTHSLLALGSQLDLKAKLQVLDKEMSKPSKVRPLFGNPRVWLAAAAILIAVSVVLFSLGRSSANVYMEEFSPYPDLTSMRNDTLNDLRTGMIAYTRGEYDIAVDYLQKFAKTNPADDFVHLYLGNAYLGLENYEKAILELELVQSPRWKQPGEWYLALAYGLNGEKDKAAKLLEKISNDENHAYKERAAELK